jgi:mRNA interferase RelE/StbE
MAPARRQIDRLPITIAAAIIETLDAIASNPHHLGKPLRFELEGCCSARRGPYRIVYRIHDKSHTVSVLAVGHRAKHLPASLTRLGLEVPIEPAGERRGDGLWRRLVNRLPTRGAKPRRTYRAGA